MTNIGSKKITHIYQGDKLLSTDNKETQTITIGDKPMSFIYQGNELLYPNPIKDGLALWYDFKGMENTSINKNIAKDLSNNGNNGTLQNFNYTSDSGYNNGLKFDGVDDYYQTNNDIPRTTKLITICITAYMPDKATNWQYLLDLTDGNGKKISIIQQWGNPDVFVNDLTNNNHNYFPSNLEKYHLVFTLDGKNLKGYINGILTTSTGTNTIDINTFTNNLKITRPSSIRMKGTLYSLKIYDKILTDQEIQHNYKLEKERWGL